MNNKTKYRAKKPNARGDIDYTAEENETWSLLYSRQYPLIQQRACSEFLDGLAALNLANDRIPQCHEVSKILYRHTGWSVVPVEALISFDEFYTLLSERKFPAASFIRTREELNYLQEPDIFHELFGHCPLLIHQAFADFTQAFGELGLRTPMNRRARLSRLYWFTVEFGLIRKDHHLKIYGGGILSSPGETEYALDSSIPKYKPFDPLEVLRTAYRYDIMQPLYYVIEKFEDFYALLNQDIAALLQQAIDLGDIFTPLEKLTTDNLHSC